MTQNPDPVADEAGPGAEELAVDWLTAAGRRVLAFENTNAVAQYAAYQAVVYGEEIDPDRSIRDLDSVTFDEVAEIAAGVADHLAIACVGCLLYFIHHISHAISVNFIVDRIAEETEAVIDETMPSPRKAARRNRSPLLALSRPATRTASSAPSAAPFTSISRIAKPRSASRRFSSFFP